jgi:hypothetical protein
MVDVIGIGAGVLDRLREQGCRAEAFNASAGTKNKDATGELGFPNCRSAAWWLMREMLDPSRDPDAALPVDDDLLGDLTAPKWKILSGGKIQVESKDDIRKRIGRSTDAGDATVQAYWQEGFGATAWIDWARKKAEAAEAERAGEGPEEVAAAPDLAAAEARVRELYPSPYQECRKPDCLRMVSLGAAYCCAPCSTAADGGYEIHAHSNGCDQRAAERGEGHAPPDDPPNVPPDPAEARRKARNAAFKAGAWT